MIGEPAAGVALDLRALQVEGWADRGIGRYIAGFAEALHRRGAVAAGLLHPRLPPPHLLPPDLLLTGLATWDWLPEARRLASGGAILMVTAPFLRFDTERPAFDHWRALGAPRVVLLHDLIPLRAPTHYLGAPGQLAAYRARAEWVAASELILTNSVATREEAIRVLGCAEDRVQPVGVGVSEFFSPPDGTDDELFRLHFPQLDGRPFLLVVGGSDPRKGVDQAIAALSVLAGAGVGCSLLVVGDLTGDWRSRLSESAAAGGVAGRVILAGAVSDQLLRAAYRRASLTVMPSLAEGAGLPVLESAACGTPALASSGGALGDTAGTPLALFDPLDPGSIASCAEAALASADRRARILSVQQRAARQSTWAAVADRAIRAIATIAPRPRQSPGPRLAVVGWDGSVETVVRRWAAQWDGATFDLFVGDPAAHGEWGAGGVAALSQFTPEHSPLGYDSVIYVIGAGEDAGEVVRLAALCPGWLWPAAGAAGRRSELVRLARRSAGLIVAGAAARHQVELLLDPLAARPPVVDASGAEDSAARRSLLGPGAPAPRPLP